MLGGAWRGLCAQRMWLRRGQSHGEWLVVTLGFGGRDRQGRAGNREFATLPMSTKPEARPEEPPPCRDGRPSAKGIKQIVRIRPRREIREIDHIHVTILAASWMMMVTPDDVR